VNFTNYDNCLRADYSFVTNQTMLEDWAENQRILSHLFGDRMSSDKSTDKTYQLFQKVQKASRPSYKYLYWNITKGAKRVLRCDAKLARLSDRFYVSHHLMNNDRAAEMEISWNKKNPFSTVFSGSSKLFLQQYHVLCRSRKSSALTWALAVVFVPRWQMLNFL